MKRMYLVIFAAVMAISVSAFTTKSADPPYKYQNDLGQWVQVPTSIDVPTVCPPSNVKQCKIQLEDALRDIFHNDQTTPYMRN